LNKRLTITALTAGLMLLNSGAAYAAADGNCGSGSSAPVFDDNIQMNSPRQCGDEPPTGASEYKPSIPDFEPPGDSALPDASAPMEPPAEPPPQPQQ
jgi:hypothetical protein